MNPKQKSLKSKIGNLCEVFSGKDGLLKAASEKDYDILLGAIVGFAGLAPTLEAIKRGKKNRTCQQRNACCCG